ncbi:hypothetical protein [Mycolicibacterium mengxianglii]|uniref:hypothetical protein n=1 Tax=Mycolicibacterium mengxianglii TaxID=2736649 RepID=UPI0018D02986|nr:hypothetical protein [Mycolicibacterium mengxianglii]
MKALAITALAAACVLSGCTRTVDGTVAQTIEPLTVDGMTCAEFSTLGDKDRMTVIDEVLPKEDTGNRRVFIVGMSQMLCKMVPEAQVKQVLNGFNRP